MIWLRYFGWLALLIVATNILASVMNTPAESVEGVVALSVVAWMIAQNDFNSDA